MSLSGIVGKFEVVGRRFGERVMRGEVSELNKVEGHRRAKGGPSLRFHHSRSNFAAGERNFD